MPKIDDPLMEAKVKPKPAPHVLDRIALHNEAKKKGFIIVHGNGIWSLRGHRFNNRLLETLDVAVIKVAIEVTPHASQWNGAVVRAALLKRRMK